MSPVPSTNVATIYARAIPSSNRHGIETRDPARRSTGVATPAISASEGRKPGTIRPPLEGACDRGHGHDGEHCGGRTEQDRQPGDHRHEGGCPELDVQPVPAPITTADSRTRRTAPGPFSNGPSGEPDRMVASPPGQRRWQIRTASMCVCHGPTRLQHRRWMSACQLAAWASRQVDPTRRGAGMLVPGHGRRRRRGTCHPFHGGGRLALAGGAPLQRFGANLIAWADDSEHGQR
jgi:hypothetical protein